jgi:hypothetical protein
MLSRHAAHHQALATSVVAYRWRIRTRRMSPNTLVVAATVLLSLGIGHPSLGADSQSASSAMAKQDVAVGSQYDSSHVYVSPQDLDRFVASFLGTFGGQSTKQVVTNVTPTPSSTLSQVLQTPVGNVSVFGYRTPIPFPFGAERTGYLVSNMDAAIRAARECGADVLVTPFPDPIGRDAIVQWPGGVNMQLYWHTKAPSSPALQTVPENRVYVSSDRVKEFTHSFLAFSHGRIVADDVNAAGIEIGRPAETYRRIRIESKFGKLVVFVTDGHLPYPYGRETTGYEVTNLADTLVKAQAIGVKVVVQPYTADQRTAALVEFPGGYIAEIHSRVTR